MIYVFHEESNSFTLTKGNVKEISVSIVIVANPEYSEVMPGAIGKRTSVSKPVETVQ